MYDRHFRVSIVVVGLLPGILTLTDCAPPRPNPADELGLAGHGAAGHGAAGHGAAGHGAAGHGAAGHGAASAVAQIAPNPDLSDVCAAEGKLAGVADGVCPLRADEWEWDESASLYGVTPEQSSLPPCPMAEESDLAGLSEPGWRLKIEKDLGVSPAGASSDHFHSVFVASRLDGTAPCGVRLVWKLKQQALKLSVGSVIRYSTAVDVRSIEDDVSITTVIRDEAGELLIGFAAGARPAVWDTQVWPELSLTIEEPPLCRDAQRTELELLRFTLSAGQDRCTLEAKSARCCSLLGASYVAKASDATRMSRMAPPGSGAKASFDSVNWIVAKKSLLAPAP